MKTKGGRLIQGIVLAGVLLSAKVSAQIKSNPSVKSAAVFPKGERVPDSTFTGAAWVKQLIRTDSAFNIPVANVTFEPGARTYWHSHAGGQVLLAMGGLGYYQERGKRLRLLRPGDVVKCPPNIAHWHGASPAVGFTQVAITPNTPRGRTVWFQKVSDKEYNNLKK